VTVVVAVALSSESEVAFDAVTLAVPLIVPGVVTVATSVIVALLPALSCPQST